MSETNRGMDILSEKDREKCIKEIVSFFLDERGEEIGVIAAGNILDFFIQSAGPGIYNKAIEDAKKSLHKQLEGLDFEIDLLRRMQ